MKIFLVCIFVGFGPALFGQEKMSIAYVLIRFDEAYDNLNRRLYYEIKAENGCDSATEFYSLKKYNNGKKAINAGGLFYSSTNNMPGILYNYFLSPTQALHYLSSHGWALITVYPEIFSGSNSEKNGNGDLVPVTTVSSRPVFCFKR